MNKPKPVRSLDDLRKAIAEGANLDPFTKIATWPNGETRTVEGMALEEWIRPNLLISGPAITTSKD